MATKSKALKAKATRRAAKQAGGELAEALQQIFCKIDNLNTSLRHARGAANAAELIGDESSDTFIQAAIHSIADQGQTQIDAAKAIVEEITDIIQATRPYRAAQMEAAARLAAAEGGAS